MHDEHENPLDEKIYMRGVEKTTTFWEKTKLTQGGPHEKKKGAKKEAFLKLDVLGNYLYMGVHVKNVHVNIVRDNLMGTTYGPIDHRTRGWKEAFWMGPDIKL